MTRRLTINVMKICIYRLASYVTCGRSMAPSGECYHLIYQFRRFVYMNINLVG